VILFGGIIGAASFFGQQPVISIAIFLMAFAAITFLGAIMQVLERLEEISENGRYANELLRRQFGSSTAEQQPPNTEQSLPMGQPQPTEQGQPSGRYEFPDTLSS
jgi:type II secretory pathway pseudopilin PulG